MRYYPFNKSNDKENSKENLSVDIFIRKKERIKSGAIFVQELYNQEKLPLK